jgi:hypothetical protein
MTTKERIISKQRRSIIEPATNIPYIKQFDANGNIINPITRENLYINNGSNRRQRSEIVQPQRFHGESKNHHLTVLGLDKYERKRQLINVKGIIKIIEHYIP